MSHFTYGRVDGEADCTVGFYLTHAFSMMAFIAALEPLRIANRLSGQHLYSWRIVSQDGLPVTPTNGSMQVPADYSLDNSPDFKVLFVAGPFDPLPYKNVQLFKWLNRLGRRDVIIGGIDTGSHILARSGLLRGKRCTIHWENMQGFVNEFPELQASHEIYEYDNNRLTCAGGTAA